MTFDPEFVFLKKMWRSSICWKVRVWIVFQGRQYPALVLCGPARSICVHLHKRTIVSGYKNQDGMSFQGQPSITFHPGPFAEREDASWMYLHV